MSWFYRAYDLTIESEFELEELQSCAPPGLHAAHVSIRSGSIDKTVLSALNPLHPQVSVGPGTLWLNIPGVAVYAVLDGHEVLIQPYPGADPGGIKLFLLGTCIGAILWQRGFTVLHGNAVRIGDGVMVCVGHSGAGKSTLAAEFIRRGFPVIADDVVAVDQNANAVQGIPRIKLWQESLDHFDLDNSNLTRLRSGEDKFSVKFEAVNDAARLPVKWIFVLEAGDCDYPHIEAIRAMEALPLLVEHSYRLELVSGFDLRGSHFLNCTQIASQAVVAKVIRPRSGFLLTQLYDVVTDFVEMHQ
ncbi:hypothetical protein [Blastomonas aquatica]|nr:hypothetical protein [Blastomonas aquatica]